MFIGQQFPWRLHWNRLSNCRKNAGHQALLGSRSQVRLSGNLPSRCNGIATSVHSDFSSSETGVIPEQVHAHRGNEPLRDRSGKGDSF
jgi:hypothetical protein